jgi:hypothetical protein
MAFKDDLDRFAKKLDGRVKDVFVGATIEVHKSIVEGSPVTSAPGQPVDTGFLWTSWIPEHTSPSTWQTTTNVSYAPAIEDGIRGAYDPKGVDRPPGFEPLGISQEGGSGSVRLTRGGWQNIVDHVRREVVRD